MRLILASGVALFEVLVSLLLFSLALLGLDGVLLSALQVNRRAFFSNKAEQQIHNLEERLQANQMMGDWNEENKLVLPQGEGAVTGVYPDYELSLCWADQDRKKACLREHFRGSTLIELMVSFTLSLMLIAMATGLYLAMEKQDALLSKLASENDQASFVLQRLESELKQAGFIGCPRLSEDFPLENHAPISFTAGNAVTIERESHSSSVLMVKYRDSVFTKLSEMQSQSVLLLFSPLDIKPGSLVLISDCRHADLFQVASVDFQRGHQALRASQPLIYHYGGEAELGVFRVRRYFLKSRGGLYSQDWGGRAFVLVDGLKRLQVDISPQGRGVALKLIWDEKNLSKTDYAFVALRNAVYAK